MTYSFPFPRCACAVALFLAVVHFAPARIVSVNIAANPTGNAAIDGNETFGVPELDTVAGNWNNINAGSALVRADGQPGAASVSLAAPGGFNFFGAGYINTPMNYGIQQFPGTPSPASVTLSNLGEEFPQGYHAVVYLTGFVANTGARITDGTTSYYYQTMNPGPASFAPGDLVRTTVDSPPEAGAAPVAQYAVFGSAEEPLTADEVTFSLTVTGTGGAGLGGVQLVSAAELGNGDENGNGSENGPGSGTGVVGTWTDPALGTYFLDAVNGDDDNDGRSPENAWQTLGTLSTRTFGPGDVILFRAGDVFTGSFFLNGGGTPENPVVFGAYGTGPKPRLEGGEGDPEVIMIFESGGLEFRHLEISNYHPGASIPERFGVRIIAPPRSGEIRHLHFHGMDFTWIQGSSSEHESRGIDAKTTTNNDAVPPTRWNGFVIEDCYFYQIDGRAVQVNDRNLTLADKIIRGTDYYPTVGFVFQNNTGRDIYRNLLQLSGTLDAVIQHNYMSGTQLGSAFWPFNAEGTLVQFNDFRHTRNPGADSYICHFDYNCIDTVMQYNFGYDVDGGLIEVIVLSGFEFFQERAIARYNIGIDIGFRDTENAAGIFLTGDVVDSKIYNNTIITTDLHPSYKALSVRNWGGEWPMDNYIYNNLFLATGSPSRLNNIQRLGERGNVLSHNLYYGNITVPPVDLSPVTGDPMLANPGGLDPSDTKLTLGSAAIAAGRIIADNGGRDFFNNPVPPDLVPSIGAHEFQTEGHGRWAGFEMDDDGFVDTGHAFLGRLWTGAARDSGWVYSMEANAWLYVPVDLLTEGGGAWFYALDIADIVSISVGGQWTASAVWDTWFALPGGRGESGPAWGYILDLNP